MVPFVICTAHGKTGAVSEEVHCPLASVGWLVAVTPFEQITLTTPPTIGVPTAAVPDKTTGVTTDEAVELPPPPPHAAIPNARAQIAAKYLKGVFIVLSFKMWAN